MSKSEKFLKIASGHKKRKKKEKFAGTYSEYLGILEEDKDVAKLAHRRLYDVLSSHGITRMEESDGRCAKLFGGDSLRTYDYFQTKFFGMERSLAKV